MLVVDDDVTIRTLLLEILEKAGYTAVGAEDGYVAEELIRDLFPDLILLDLKMPRSSGWSLLGNVRERPRWQSIPVIIVSGYLHEGESLPATGLNIVGRIEKPVQIEDLLAKVHEVLDA